jgi:aspartate aminotransferase-like enzyme
MKFLQTVISKVLFAALSCTKAMDAVHGFGVEDVEMADAGCDFFIAGCHKARSRLTLRRDE